MRSQRWGYLHNLHNNGCPIETMCGVKGAYDIVKAFNSIKTTPKAGADIPALIKAQLPDYYPIHDTILAKVARLFKV